MCRTMCRCIPGEHGSWWAGGWTSVGCSTQGRPHQSGGTRRSWEWAVQHHCQSVVVTYFISAKRKWHRLSWHSTLSFCDTNWTPNWRPGATFWKLSEEVFRRWFGNSKEVFFSKFLPAVFAFRKELFFSYLCKLVQPVKCAYTDYVTKKSLENFPSSHIDGQRNLHTALLFKLPNCQFSFLTQPI